MRGKVEACPLKSLTGIVDRRHRGHVANGEWLRSNTWHVLSEPLSRERRSRTYSFSYCSFIGELRDCSPTSPRLSAPMTLPHDLYSQLGLGNLTKAAFFSIEMSTAKQSREEAKTLAQKGNDLVQGQGGGHPRGLGADAHYKPQTRAVVTHTVPRDRPCGCESCSRDLLLPWQITQSLSALSVPTCKIIILSTFEGNQED